MINMAYTEQLERINAIKTNYGMHPYQLLIGSDQEWRTQNTYTERFDYPENKPGVYFFLGIKNKDPLNDIELIYIGSSKNIKQRKQGHDLLKKIKGQYDHVHLYFKYCNNYILEERKLIKQFNPKFNIYG